MRAVSRRRAMTILASSCAAAVLPRPAGSTADAGPPPYEWRGIALGAEASLTIFHRDRRAAAGIVADCLEEVGRLERIFSLHRPDSAITRLNRDGFLAEPPLDLVHLLSQALLVSSLSGGRFDPSVQPLWQLLADHFARPDADPAGPAAAALAAAQRAVDWRAIDVSSGRIAFRKAGMRITLNGIAQGYVSDRVGDLLRSRGLSHVLVNLGETLAIDRRADSRPWRIGIADPQRRATMVAFVELADGAVATSAGSGLVFDRAGRFNHLIDPRRGACADPGRGVTVTAATATVADGLSTVIALMPDPAAAAPLLRQYDARAFVYAAPAGGTWIDGA